MSKRQWKRLDAVGRIGLGKLTVGEAAEVLGLSRGCCGHRGSGPRAGGGRSSIAGVVTASRRPD